MLSRIEPSLALLDAKLPDASGLERVPELSEICPVLVLTAYGSIDQAVTAIKQGAADYLTKPISPDALDLVVRRTLAVSSMRRDYEFLRRQANSAAGKALLGKSAAMAELRKMIGIVGPSETTAMIIGESGVGKELVAAAVHQASNRSKANFIAIDCSTLPANLFESELFGHERGAFTGATTARAGCLELANQGTLFLDEIGDMPVALQSKLLRVLEDHKVRRVGGTSEYKVELRVVAATNADVPSLLGNGRFREDLYDRLNVFTLQLPPLRERAADIPALAQHFLALYAQENNRPVVDWPTGQGYPNSVSVDPVAIAVDHEYTGTPRRAGDRAQQIGVPRRGRRRCARAASR